jgi:hypothetical protein
MTVEAWLDAVLADADRRGLAELKPLLLALAESTRALRAADFDPDASGRRADPPLSTDQGTR